MPREASQMRCDGNELSAKPEKCPAKPAKCPAKPAKCPAKPAKCPARPAKCPAPMAGSGRKTTAPRPVGGVGPWAGCGGGQAPGVGAPPVILRRTAEKERRSAVAGWSLYTLWARLATTLDAPRLPLRFGGELTNVTNGSGFCHRNGLAGVPIFVG